MGEKHASDVTLSRWQNFDIKPVINEKLCHSVPRLNNEWVKLPGSLLNGKYSADWQYGISTTKGTETSIEVANEVA